VVLLVSVLKMHQTQSIFQFENGNFTVDSSMAITAADLKIESASLKFGFDHDRLRRYRRDLYYRVGKDVFGVRIGASPNGKGGVLVIGANTYEIAFSSITRLRTIYLASVTSWIGALNTAADSVTFR
jgi:hypothetical protein